MHDKNLCSEFLDIFKNDFSPTGAYAPMSQSGFSILSTFPYKKKCVCSIHTQIHKYIALVIAVEISIARIEVFGPAHPKLYCIGLRRLLILFIFVHFTLHGYNTATNLLFAPLALSTIFPI
jgi:hypothetical protein